MTAPGATIIPHPPIIWEHVRTLDLLFLLSLGAASEMVFRGIVLLIKKKPSALVAKENNYAKLQYNTDRLRKLGPSAFVECSKSERQLLALDKELQQLYQQRQIQREKVVKVFSYARNFLSVIVFLLYRGVAVLSFSGFGEPGSLESKSILVPMLFPISVVGLGFKISKWGLEETAMGDGISALIPLWAGATFVTQLFDGVEHLILK
jgi:hypothetical protein